MTDLPPLTGDSYSLATAISDRGVVLGVSVDLNFNPRAFIWQNGNMKELNGLVAVTTPLFLQTACSINARGEIVGIAGIQLFRVHFHHRHVANVAHREFHR